MVRAFSRFAEKVSVWTGRPVSFVASALIVVVWGISGPFFHYSDTWQLVINTGTTIITFLMVFVIQNSQNRDSKAIHAKLDELIRAMESARNEFMDAEEEPEQVLDRQIRELRALAQAQPHLTDEIASRVAEIGADQASGTQMDGGDPDP